MQSAGETGFQQGHQGSGEVIKLIMRGGKGITMPTTGSIAIPRRLSTGLIFYQCF